MKTPDSHQQFHASHTRSKQPFFGATSEQAFFSKGRSQPSPFFTSPSIPLQTKLAVGAGGDQHEQEADGIASEIADNSSRLLIQQSEEPQSVQDISGEILYSPLLSTASSDLLQRFDSDQVAEDVVRAGEARTGKLKWQPNPGTLFDAWEENPVKDPTNLNVDDIFFDEASAISNCWDAVLYCAYRAGAVSKEWILNLYKDVQDEIIAENRRREESNDPRAGRALDQADVKMLMGASVGRALGRDIATVMNPVHGQIPQRGDLVFLGDQVAHVMLYAGTDSGGFHECVSLWEPDNTGKQVLQKIKLEDHYANEMTNGELSYARPPWSKADIRPPLHQRLWIYTVNYLRSRIY